MTKEKNVKHVHVKFIVNNVKQCSLLTTLNVLKCSNITATINNLIIIILIIMMIMSASLFLCMCVMCWGRWSGLYICYFVWFQLISLSLYLSLERLSWHFRVSQDRRGLRCGIYKGRDCSSKVHEGQAHCWALRMLSWMKLRLEALNPHRQPGRRQLEVPSMLCTVGSPPSTGSNQAQTS